jgi:hypothetical protein
MEQVRLRPELVLALSNHVLEGGDCIPKLALTVFSSLTSEDESMPGYILECLGEAKTADMLLQGLMKVQSVSRALACQVANNFLMSGIGLERVCFRLIGQAAGEKDRVKLEISYYLKAFSETAPEDFILECIKRCKLLSVLQGYSQAAPTAPTFGREIVENAVKALATIRQRFNESNP